jgi:hypothetical protein
MNHQDGPDVFGARELNPVEEELWSLKVVMAKTGLSRSTGARVMGSYGKAGPGSSVHNTNARARISQSGSEPSCTPCLI